MIAQVLNDNKIVYNRIKKKLAQKMITKMNMSAGKYHTLFEELKDKTISFYMLTVPGCHTRSTLGFLIKN